MKIISCPWCKNSLTSAISTEVCATCGKPLHSAIPTTSTISPSSETSERDPDVTADSSHLEIQSHSHRVLFRFSRFSPLRKGSLLPRLLSNYRPQKLGIGRFEVRRTFSIPLTLDQLEDEMPLTGPLQDQVSEDNDLSHVRPNGQLTWQKVIKPSPQRQSYSYPPRPPVPEEDARAVHLSQSSLTLQQLFKRSTIFSFKHISPKVMFWISTAILLITISLFGIASTFGQRQSSTSSTETRLSLQITPNELSVGATMTLRGEHFSPLASIGLTRDGAIPLIDTNGAHFVQADQVGHFTDTIFVGSNWGIGSHMIMAEDSVQHQVASFPILVDGPGTSLRPPHLHLSVNTLDFGVGDQATNSTKTLTLANGGSSEITWRGSTSEPWLLISPTQGNFSSDIPQQVTIAVDRSRLQPGSYTAQVNFSSNGGDETLTVSIQVMPLKADKDAILQVSPSVLSFTVPDGSSTTTSQQVRVSNSGGQTMNWQVSSDAPWLTISSPSSSVTSGGFTNVQVSVASRNLLPGTYTGMLTFTAQNAVGNGKVSHSSQQVLVSLTIASPCTLQVTSGVIDFSSAYLQPATSPKTVSLAASAGCAHPLNWDAKSNADWLKLNNTHGTTPSTLSFRVDVSGLRPNTYKGSITFSSPTGTQTVVVRLMIGPADTAAISANPSSLSFQSTAGQAGPAAKTVTLTNTGEGVLKWQANAITNQNPPWFQVTPSSGRLAAHQTTTLTVTVTSSTALASGDYNGAISLSGTNGAGQRATGSHQSISVTYIVTAPPPPLQVTTPSNVNINAPGTTSLPVNLKNTGGSPLNWSAALQSGTPAFVSLSTTSGSNLAGGAMASFNLVVNTNGVANGQYQTNVQINAINVITGQSVVGSQATIPINVTTASSFMQVSTTNLTFSAPTGSTVKPQSLTITNSGGTTLSWKVSAPARSWLSINTIEGNTPPGASSSLVFSIQTSHLVARATPYTDQVVITPSVGNPVTVNISLTVTNLVPKLKSPPTTTITPTTSPATSATSTPVPTPSAVPTPVPTASATPTPAPSPSPTSMVFRGTFENGNFFDL